jgi:PAS domain S-box-containing protein
LRRRRLHRAIRPIAAAPRLKVLLAGDGDDEFARLAPVLREGDLDHELVVAHSSPEALQALVHGEFAVILLDERLPEAKGLATAELIRARPSTAKTPILFIAGADTPAGCVRRAWSLCAADVVRLPVAPEVLRARVQVFVELHRKFEGLKQEAETLRRRQEREHAERLAEATDRIALETRRNRLFELAPDMLGVAGFDGRLRQLNESWQRTLGYGAAELCARPLYELLHQDDRLPMRLQLRALADGLPQARFENRFLHADGSWRRLSWTAVPFRQEGLVYVYVRDVTESRASEQADAERLREEERRRAVERDDAIKDHFLATLSHELRSPLTPILGWTTMLRSGRLEPAETERALAVIERNAHVQARRIDDLLDVSRIMSGRLRLDASAVELRAAVVAGVEAVRAGARHRGVALEVAPGPEAAYVVGDRERLEQVVRELVTNAVKFSDPGGAVTVELEAGPDVVRLRVRDCGAGVSPEFLPHVFERFRQGNTGSTRGHGGLGLGLTIVRHVVLAHGGAVTAASEGVGRGACFTVVLPRAAVEPREADATGDDAQPLAPAALAGRRVLVVDGEPDARELLQAALAGAGARVSLAGSVDEALASVAAAHPDLIVTDIAMPGADGFVLAERLGLRDGGVPALALTAYSSPDDGARARAAGFREALVKPVDPGVVVSTLARLARAGGDR